MDYIGYYMAKEIRAKRKLVFIWENETTECKYYESYFGPYFLLLGVTFY